MKIVLLAWTREVIRVPLQSILSIIGVALGVTAVVAVHVANHSARESFLAASSAMQETATHSITGEPSDQLYRQIRLATDYPAQPVVSGSVRVVDADNLSAILYGIDPVAYFEFNNGSDAISAAAQNVNPLLAEAFSVFATLDTLQQLDAEVGTHLTIRFAREDYDFRIAGLIETRTPLQTQSYRRMLLTDIATAQTVLGMRGQLSSIQLQLPPDETARLTIEMMLSRDTQLEGGLHRQQSMASITEAFQTNLTAMSLLALLVAIFLIYNTMTFLVMRRRPIIEILRALGVSRTGILSCLVLEAVFVGLSASMMGVVIGSQLAEFLLALVERSINDLYFPIDADIAILSPATVLLALALGIGSTLLASLPAMRETLNISPSFGNTGHRSTFTDSRRRIVSALTASGVLIIAGVATMQLFPTSIMLGFTSIYLIVAGYLCLVPMLCKALGQAIRAIAKQCFGIRGVLTGRALAMTRGKTSVSICAMCLAISAAIGVSIMISSFRTAVDVWIGDRLSAEFYVSTQGHGDQLNALEINQLQTVQGVESVGVANWTWLQSEGGRSRIFAVDYGERAFAGYRFKEQVADVWMRFQEGGVIVSEPYAWRHQVGIGDTLELWNSASEIQVPIIGVFFDYSSDRGVVAMHRNVYISKFGDRTITTAAIFSQPDADRQALEDAVGQSITGSNIRLWSARGLHEASMEVFDQTFAVTAVLRSLAVIVAIVAVVSTLAMVQIDRGQELRIQNAVGFTAREIWASASIESAVMGLIAGLLSLPVGLMQTWLLIWVVNQRSFGWTMPMVIDGSILIEAVCLSVFAALLAGIVPAWWLATRVPRQMLQTE